MNMQLSELIKAVAGEEYNIKETEVRSLDFDSRNVEPGALFIAVKGERFDGHNFINDAAKNGAVAVVTQHRVQTELPQVVVQDSRAAMGKLARRFYDGFDDVIKIGITGTNGKTTTSFFIHSILELAGKKPGLIGTIYYIGKTKAKAVRTTPESLEIFKLLDQFKRNGAEVVVMEVSSHALSLNRVDELRFQAALLTNLSQDHLDFHQTMDAYRRAKLRLFSLITEDGFAVFNLDDPVSRSIEDMHLKNTITYGVKNRGDVWAEIVKDTLDELAVDVFYKNRSYKIKSNLIGTFNVYNMLAAFAAGVAIGVEVDTIIAGIEDVQSVRGRMERVVDNVFVDYAHTPSAIENALGSLRQYAQGKLLVVFGCGGDRDKEKRPKMGNAASRLADFSIITSDNPRSEPPGNIIEDIEKGMSSNNYKIIEDRREAIRHAISLKREQDILLVAGKGHEDYQVIGDRKIEFDDAEVIRACFENI